MKRVSNTLNLLSRREEGPWQKSSLQADLRRLAEDKAAAAEMQEIVDWNNVAFPDSMMEMCVDPYFSQFLLIEPKKAVWGFNRYMAQRPRVLVAILVHCKLPSTVRSTFLMAFSPDSTKVASTHGDHKIYICCVKTGKLLHKLEGHPRTPWCVAFHPTSNDILASGCLGGEVRVWDLHGGSERWLAEQNTVITSLTFHPFDKVLVIATYNQLHFWNWSHPRPFAMCKTSSEREKVRFVKFDHLGARLITGIANLPLDDGNNENVEVPVAPRTSHPLSTSSLRSHRRSILSRLISMYHQMEGLEELSRYQEPYPRPESPTEEEAINQARDYATATNRLAFLHRHIRLEQALFGGGGSGSSSLAGLPAEYSHLQDELENPDLSDSNDSYASRYFWTTFQRLRLICTSLERRLPHQIRNLEQQPDGERNVENENPANSSAEQEPNPESSGNDGEVRHSAQHRASVSLINLLNRLQHSLRSAMLSTSYAQEQIEQVQRRISELLERLTSVTGYRARLSSLRDQIYDVADRAMRRGHETSPGQRWDLAHCLWLVEMSLELTRQMQRILQADFRLTHLHLSSPASEISSSSASSENSSNDSSSRNSDVSSGTQTAVNSSARSDRDTSSNQNSQYGLSEESTSSSFMNEDIDSSAQNELLDALSTQPNFDNNSLENSTAPDDNVASGPRLTPLSSSTQNILNALSARSSPDSCAYESAESAPNESVNSDSHFSGGGSSSTCSNLHSLMSHLRSSNSSLQNSQLVPNDSGTPEQSVDSSSSRPRTSSSRRDSSRVRSSLTSRGLRESREFLLNRRTVLRRRYRLLHQMSAGLNINRESRNTARRTDGQSSAWTSSVWQRTSRSFLFNMPSSSGTSAPPRATPECYTGLFRHYNMSPVPPRADDATSSAADNEESDADNQEWDSGTDQQRERMWSDPTSTAYLDNSSSVPQFRIDPPPGQNEPEPLPAYDRPRSPPLSEILSSINGAGDPADPAPTSIFGQMPGYLSMIYESGLRSHVVPDQIPSFTHRIQSWDFSKCQMPNLSNSKCNIVVPRCKIHNDASVDISKDGEMLVALVPSSEVLARLMLRVHSLKPETLGQLLYSLPSRETNAISVSLSPLGRYVVVGLASPRLYLSNTEKDAVAQIFKLEPDGKLSVPKHVRCLTQQGSETYYPPVSLNSVRWLPHPGQGLIYGTNRGCLCICKPVAPMKISRRKTLFQGHRLSMGVVPRVRYPSPLAQQPTSSASTQTIGPQTQTTGTQTFSFEGSSNARR